MSFGYSPSAGSKISVQINANFVEIKGAEGIPEYGYEKGTYEVTTISDTAKQFGEDLPDPGEFTLSGVFDSTDQGQAYIAGLAATTGSIATLKSEFAKKPGGTSGEVDTFSVLVLSFKKSAAKGGPQKFQSKMKLTGTVNSTPAV